MPRGRHRHSPPLHRLLPPTAVAGASVLCAGGAWLLADPLVLRLLVAAAAAAAVTGAVLMRNWDRTAGRRVADLTRARASDEWRTEERIAELEADLEEARELRAKLDAKLRAKRVELAKLRNEHAGLLRRYATAETERASALEGRRQLALGTTGDADAVPGSAEPGAAAGATGAELVVATTAPTPGDYLRAARALQNLTRNAAAQEARRIAEAALRKAPGSSASAASAMRHVPAAAAIVPPTPQRRPAPRPEGSFDFFGMEGEKALRKQGGGKQLTAKQPAPAIEAVQQEDLADVVGEEALAEAENQAEEPAETRAEDPAGARAEDPAEPRGEERPEGRPQPVRPRGADHAVGEVIDLTAHDETEQIDVMGLRNAVSS
ncbi:MULTISPECIES: hypothetical protein [unclassified Streptomyces]|uniref:hypothetical protein n=1 Tax=unclassified Streptomyces TaxID=2593676 RepID=UPI0009A0EEA3|nr:MULTISPECIES: hypothetical protein [unclassified Streptomyces]